MKIHWTSRNVEYRLWLNEASGCALRGGSPSTIGFVDNRIQTLTLEVLAHSGPLYYGLAGVRWIGRASEDGCQVEMPSVQGEVIWNESLHSAYRAGDVVRTGLPEAYLQALEQGMLRGLDGQREFRGKLAICDGAYSEGGSSTGVFRALGSMLVRIIGTISRSPSITESSLAGAVPDFREYLLRDLSASSSTD